MRGDGVIPDSIRDLPLPGSCVRVVYSIDGFELFAIGVLIRSSRDHIVMEQYSDQYGPVDPFRLTIQWATIIRMTVNGPALANDSGRPRTA
jgi:hypothetical protein